MPGGRWRSFGSLQLIGQGGHGSGELVALLLKLGEGLSSGLIGLGRAGLKGSQALREGGGVHGWECLWVIGEGQALRSDAIHYTAPPVVGASI